ncbi:MAG: AMP-binding protein, partial [Alphaproteobacteria bacterium]|nr:AMP-binding protein [Alphaproteobacteria bacterium]
MDGDAKLPDFGKPKTIDNVLSRFAVSRPDAPAVIFSGGEVLNYGALAAQVALLRERLLSHGVRATDRVALMVPRGGDAVAAFFAVIGCATLVPVERDISGTEFEDLMSRMGIGFLVTTADCPPAIADVARKGQVKIVKADPPDRAQPSKYDAPVFDPSMLETSPDIGPNSIALLLRTSGTTGRSKIVPVTHFNSLSAAEKIVQWFDLSAEDRCLSLMPLYHSHGICVGMLTPFWSGGSTIMPNELSVQHIVDLIENQSPSWVTGAASFYRMILAYAKDEIRKIDAPTLRFLRAASEALSPADAAAVERLLDIPMITSYGMTETQSQIVAKPLANGESCIGSVGLPVTAEIAVLDEAGAVRSEGKGEVLVRGDGVFAGYLDDPEATAAAFHEGWFQTGDFGRIEIDGSLSLCGRLKEIISRGGEKFAPAEIDNVLATHPDVAEAVTFPVPHPSLGEIPAAAVVLKAGARVSEEALVGFLRERLADFKVPARIVFVDEIPKSAVGKIQRGQLARVLGIDRMIGGQLHQDTAKGREPTELEYGLQRLWKKALRVEHVGLNDNFFMLGGDSLQALELFLQIEREIGRRVPLSILYEATTVAEMAACIEKNDRPEIVFPIRSKGHRPPFFSVHATGGEILDQMGLSRHLGEDQPFYALQAIGVDDKEMPVTRMEELAACYIEAIKSVQPQGPYFIGGPYGGGVVAYEMARQLKAAGEEIALLALIHSSLGGAGPPLGPPVRFWGLA